MEQPEKVVESPVEGHLYGYAGNDPVSFKDPNGEFVVSSALAIGAGIGAIAGGISAAANVEGSLLSSKNLAAIATGAAIGAGAGAASVVVGAAGLATAIVGNAIVGGVSDVATQTLVEGKDFKNLDLGRTAVSSTVGAVAGAIGGVVGISAFNKTSVIGNPTGVKAAISNEQVTGAIVGGTTAGVLGDQASKVESGITPAQIQESVQETIQLNPLN